jgi:nucleotide-binding universal stress UspA family protein
MIDPLDGHRIARRDLEEHAYGTCPDAQGGWSVMGGSSSSASRGGTEAGSPPATPSMYPTPGRRRRAHIARPGERGCKMFTRILVPLDRSESAARAVEPALSLAEKYGARMTLLMVMFRAPLPDPESREGAFLDQYFEQHGQQYLEEICATRMRTVSVPVDRVVRLGTAAEGILEYAVESYAALIVMSTHGTTGTRSSLGSTAWKILQEAPCPVLLLPAKPPTGEHGAEVG